MRPNVRGRLVAGERLPRADLRERAADESKSYEALHEIVMVSKQYGTRAAFVCAVDYCGS